MVRQAIKFNMLTRMKVGRNKVDSCALQFVDDTLFMCEDSFSNIFTIKAILSCYELASRLKIDFHKSKLAGINVDRNSFECYAKSLKCTLMNIPFKYMVLEVGGNPRKMEF